MTVLIKNMESPKTCSSCQFYDDISRYCDAEDRHLYRHDLPKPVWCPIEEVKEDGKL